ncbi:uncharacterized protein LOC114535227 [Dendronephthya gigantea]|uniref:uncharacterized protein LOC114535227 n=1 Tax=Dendronephthya gigantea TaxID=151771 RepID=UPI00106B1DCF|nr:uncharacterized protein LOC114535227 [Dendronephthya gigantea]XP_028412416.1 uncharacterized protein LOC114535227 [Dendronephthya gigantea]
MGMSAGNIAFFGAAIGFIVFHILVFTNLTAKLQTSLQRVDDLEQLLKNATKKSSANSITSSCLDELKMRLDSELATGDINVKVLRILRKIKRSEKRIENCIVNLRNKRQSNPSRQTNSNSNCKCNEVKYALYTIWGVKKCPASSQRFYHGQMVTTDGSDYICLPDNPEDIPIKVTKTKGRTLGSSVFIRGVTYDDIEDTVVRLSGPVSNNKTIPCAVCARKGKSSSKMIYSMPKTMRKMGIQREYFGILMSAKKSRKFVCLSVDARGYDGNMTKTNWRQLNTIKLHPAELRCNSMYCEVNNKTYNDGHRVKCMVVTF